MNTELIFRNNLVQVRAAVEKQLTEEWGHHAVDLLGDPIIIASTIQAAAQLTIADANGMIVGPIVDTHKMMQESYPFDSNED